MFALLLLLVSSLSLRAHSDETSTYKETNYRKFIGEREFKIPLQTELQEPLSLGQTIHTVGRLSEEPKRVDINFKKGKPSSADIPLHLSLRYEETGIFSKNGKLVYNTRENLTWGTNEQRISNPFEPGHEFDLRVRILDGKYKVYANRVDIGDFEQRQNITGITHVELRGDFVQIRLFHYGGRIYPNPYTAIADLVPGKRLDFSGVPTGDRFEVNLYRRSKEHALHISARLDEGVIVRNAMSHSIWGEEERDGKMPLEKWQIFDLTIINDEFSLLIFVNGKRFTSFAHRGAPNDVQTLEIIGDVEIHTVTVNNVENTEKLE